MRLLLFMEVSSLDGITGKENGGENEYLNFKVL